MSLLLRLLTLGHASGSAAVGRIQYPHFHTPSMRLLLVVLLAGAVLLAWRVYAREPAYVAAPIRRLLAGLRICSYVIVLFMLSGAFVELTRSEEIKGNIMVLVDASRSMGIVDRRSAIADVAAAARILGAARAADATTATRTDLVKAAFANPTLSPIHELEQRFNLEGYTFGETTSVSPLEILPSSTPGGPLARLRAPTDDATQLGSALLDARRHAKGRQLAGVIVVSDGGSNRGEDPVAAASALGVPVYAVGIGLPLDKDLSIPFLSCEELVFKDDHVPLTVRIRQRGYVGRTTTLVIKRIDEEKHEELVKEEPITLPDEPESVRTIDLVPDRAGTFTYVAEITPFPDQADSGNTHRAKPGIHVVDKKIRVLLVDDGPRYEFRFLKSILESDRQRIAPTFILRHGESLGHGAAELHRFPGSLAEVRAFDVIILGDIGADFFSQEQMAALEEFVHLDGGGLIVIAGDTSMPTTYLTTSLAAMLPVECDAVAPLVLEDDLHRTLSDAFHVQLTPEGMRWNALRFDVDPADNQRDWDRAVPLTWLYPTRAIKPGATVLACDPARALGDAKMPIIASQHYGKGRVLFFASDEDWRWRFQPGTAQHRRFWGQIVTDMAMAHLLGASDRVQVETEHSEYAVGDHVQLIARVRDADFNPLAAASVTATIERDLSRTTVELAAREDQPGVFVGEWIPTALGSHRISVENAGERADRVISVAIPRIEFEDIGQHQELLQRMAAVSGGHYLPLENLDQLATLLRARTPATQQRRAELTLWNAPGVLLLLGLVLGAEWLLRKRADLL